MQLDDMLFVGVKGQVVAFEKYTGRQIWATTLPVGSFITRGYFVNVILDENLLFAHSHGELFALDVQTGSVLWHNGLKGLGYGLATMVTRNAPNNFQAVMEQKMDEERSDDAGTTTTST